ncbi:hypothetical protein GWN26_08955, partial [Candidatus Saccharibacteria bacterium]|nr:hypothetical protein [Candidatus Saccharibacteria bacterium]
GGGGSPGDLLYVNGNGKVGIGTSNPTYKLDVNGAILASSGMKSLGGDTGVYGQGATYGVYGKKGSSSTGNFGYLGSTNYGAYGKSFNITGIYGEGPTGVHGKSTSNSIGVQGDGGTGVYGNGTKIGVYATGGNWAVWSQGNCHVTGVLTKSIGAFKIDHPLDPANKFLYHSFVESPDMKNIYDGVVKLDDKGEAIVELPDWFEALNTDFRYQLTAIGAPGPNLYIAEKISNNRFKIAGGKAAMEVSWHVTGIRNDAYAKAHRIKVEVNKRPEERGKYLAPIEHGFPESLGIGYAERMRIKTEQASFLEK